VAPGAIVQVAEDAFAFKCPIRTIDRCLRRNAYPLNRRDERDIGDNASDEAGRSQHVGGVS
jgi:hypothetical protein